MAVGGGGGRDGDGNVGAIPAVGVSRFTTGGGFGVPLGGDVFGGDGVDGGDVGGFVGAGVLLDVGAEAAAVGGAGAIGGAVGGVAPPGMPIHVVIVVRCITSMKFMHSHDLKLTFSAVKSWGIRPSTVTLGHLRSRHHFKWRMTVRPGSDRPPSGTRKGQPHAVCFSKVVFCRVCRLEVGCLQRCERDILSGGLPLKPYRLSRNRARCPATPYWNVGCTFGHGLLCQPRSPHVPNTLQNTTVEKNMCSFIRLCRKM